MKTSLLTFFSKSNNKSVAWMSTENLAIRANTFDLKISQKLLAIFLQYNFCFNEQIRCTSQFFEWQTMSTAQKKFSIKDFFSKCDQIRSFLADLFRIAYNKKLWHAPQIQSKPSNGRGLKTPKLPRVPKLPHFKEDFLKKFG